MGLHHLENKSITCFLNGVSPYTFIFGKKSGFLPAKYISNQCFVWLKISRFLYVSFCVCFCSSKEFSNHKPVKKLPSLVINRFPIGEIYSSMYKISFWNLLAFKFNSLFYNVYEWVVRVNNVFYNTHCLKFVWCVF